MAGEERHHSEHERQEAIKDKEGVPYAAQKQRQDQGSDFLMFHAAGRNYGRKCQQRHKRGLNSLCKRGIPHLAGYIEYCCHKEKQSGDYPVFTSFHGCRFYL